MFKRVFLLWFSIIICQYSYAIFKPVQASIFYPVVKYMADARQVVAIDFSIEQLQAVIGRAPHDKIENLFISMGKVPEILSGIPPNSVDVVLLSHVLHYLKPEEAEATLKGIHEILKIDGMVYLQALTYRAAPYSYSYDTKGQAFMLGLYGKQDEYDKAVAAGKEYNPWPTYLGWLDNFRDSIPMIHPQYLPALVEACKRNGFSISQAGIYGLMDGNLSESGEGAGDALGIIAIKKEKNSAVEHEVTVK